jgi:hypothetical protein
LSFYLSVILSACLFVCLSLFFVSLLPLFHSLHSSEDNWNMAP